MNSFKVERAARKPYKSLLKYLIVRNFFNNFTLVGHKTIAPIKQINLLKKKHQPVTGVTSHFVITVTLCNT